MILKIDKCEKIKIDVGDIMMYENKICLVIYAPDNPTPYSLIDLERSRYVESFSSLRCLQNNAKLLLKGENVVIIEKNKILQKWKWRIK